MKIIFSSNLFIILFRIEETEEEIQKRLHKWDKYLETDAQKSEVRTEPAADSDDESTVSKDSEKIEEEVLKEAGNA